MVIPKEIKKSLLTDYKKDVAPSIAYLLFPLQTDSGHRDLSHR